MFGWYLFLGEAFNDHPWNYEVLFGCRVIPILGAIGRNLDHLLSIEGFVERARTIATTERSQPNGGLFETLVAAAYARAGWRVRFKPTNPGEKTHDLDVEKDGKRFAVECKRMEGGEFAEAERARMRELWRVPCMGLVQKEQRSTYLDVRFKIQLAAVPDDYLLRRTIDFLKSGMPARLWDDHVGSGVIGDLDLNPIQEVLKTELDPPSWSGIQQAPDRQLSAVRQHDRGWSPEVCEVPALRGRARSGGCRAMVEPLRSGDR